MGMNIDPSGRNDQPGRIDFAPPGPGFATDCRDRAAVDRDIAGESGRACSVDDFPIPNYEVVHGANLPKPTKSGASLTGKVRAGAIICRAMDKQVAQGWIA